MKILVFLLYGVLASASLSAAGGVSLTQDSRFFRLANGKIKATISKRTGNVTGLAMQGQELLGGRFGYWSMAASSGKTPVDGFGESSAQAVVQDPAVNGGARAEVACVYRGTGADGNYPGRAEIRYSLGAGSTTLYVCAILHHGKGDAPFRLGEGRFAIKLDPGVFDHLTVDEQRNRKMPSGKDWDAGKPLNLKEARRLTTGEQKGWAEHKYAYSAMLSATPAYGWVGTEKRLGLWMCLGNQEYIAGGPTKMELTGHLDVGQGGWPTLLNMWHGSHYGGSVLGLAKDEVWSKVIGPFGLHVNAAGGPEELWKDALAAAAGDAATWPYEWMKHPDYPPAGGRGSITGTIRIQDPGAPDARIDGIWVGLTAPDGIVPGQAEHAGTVGWQRDGKHYQYWAKAGQDGAFKVPAVRPGTYVLRVFARGVLGEFARSGLEVEAGTNRELGEILWQAERAGPTIWQIGEADRSAAEFRNGDRYWHWGNYFRYQRDFPRGVDYTVGASDWRKDWHICQPLKLDGRGRVIGESTWNVRFPLAAVPAGGARLRLSFCGARQGARVVVLANGKEVGETGPLPENGAMHRDSHRGLWFERAIDVPPERLTAGDNLLQLRLKGSVWHQGVLYDCVRLEARLAP